MISNRKAALCATVFALAVMVGASCFADDVVGVMGVDAGTNDVTEVTMPFSPMGEGLPADFISGNFMCDGSPLSDRLYVYSRATGLMTNALFSADGRITLRFIKARGVTTSVCHRTYIYQDGKLVYTNR